MMIEHCVVVVGGGPSGLTLAGELALAGVDVAIVERRVTQELPGLRAGGLLSRTIEVFDQRGIADRFISQGQVHKMAGFGLIHMDMSDFPTRHNYLLALWQNHIEQILADWVTELGVPIYRGREVAGCNQDDTSVEITVFDGEVIRASYVVGCDGGRSVIRKSAGIEFPGWEPTTSWLIAEAEMSEAPQFGFHDDDAGRHAIGKVEEVARVRVVMTDRKLTLNTEPILQDVRDALLAVYGSDFGIHSPAWISRFTDMARQAAAYRSGRVLLAGDAAHVHPPHGGQGLNSGVQDAVNLGWKLARVVKGTSPDTLLDTYHAERHPVGARVLRNTLAQVAITRVDERSKALHETVSDLFRLDEPRKRVVAMMCGLDIRYDLGEGHPLIGRRMPDLDIVTGKGPERVYSLLHSAQPVLLNFGNPGSIDLAPWAERVRLTEAQCSGTWELPVVGGVSTANAVLVRPDGYVAWAGETAHSGLYDALTTWFGPPNVV